MAEIEKIKLGESTACIVQKINQAIDAINNSGFTSSTVGSQTQPIYLANGVATPCTYTLEKSVPSNAVFTDTKNTAGSTDSSSKLYLIGATSQAANPQTYSHDTAYVGTNGKLYSGGKVVYASGDTIPEAYLTWGGRNSVGSYAPIDAAMIPALGANRLAFMPASGVTIEYSQDGGTTWKEYSTTDAGKINLFNGNGTSYYIGGSTATKIDKSAHMLRVTIETDTANVYTILNKFAIYISTNGSTGCYCTITGRTQANYTAGTDTWNTFVDKQSISGWSGWNIINTSLTTYGNQSTHYRQVRFTFGVTSHANTLTYAGLTITKILGFGGVGWETPSNLAATGNIFSYDYLQNVTFPSGVSAKSFTENGTALSDKYQAKGNYLTSITKSQVTTALGYTPPTSDDISTAIENLVDSAPGALNTLNELAEALGDDPNFATTITNQIAGKLGKTEKAADSAKLNGKEASHYLNYNNLSNKPTIPVFPTDWELTNNLYLGQDKTELLGTDGLIRIGDGIEIMTSSAMDIYTDVLNLSATNEITIASSDNTIHLNSQHGVYVNNVEVGQTLDSLQTQLNGKLGVGDKASYATVADSANAVAWGNVTGKPSSYYTLPTASSSTLGGVKIGSNITNTSGTISLTKSNVTTALSYTPVSKSGDTLNDGATLKFSTYGTRFITISGNSINADMSNETGGWAGNFASVKDPSGTTTAMLGWYGGATGLTHIYMGGAYNDPFMKFTTDGQFTFKKTPKVGTASLALASEVNTALNSAKSYTDTAVAGIVNSAPDALNTLKELSTALGDDPNFATTVANQIGGKLGKTEKAADSDKLDGQDGSYYLNYNNLTNKPSIPSAYNLPLAASGTRGGIQIGYTASGANIPLQLSSEKAYVALTSSAVTSALTYTPANDTAVVKLAGSQTITGDKITTGTFTIRNGSASGAFVLGADVNAKTLTANQRKLGRMGVPSYDSTTKTVAGISFDSQVNANYADFGGHPNNASSIAPDVIRFVVANEHNNSVSGARTLALQISNQAGLSDTAGGGTSVVGAKFFVPVISTGDISATSFTENGTALSSKYQAKGNYLTGITKSQVTTALGYTPATQDTATTSKAGLMSATDKTKLDGLTNSGITVETVDVEQLVATQDVATFRSLTQRYLNKEIVINGKIGSENAIITGVFYQSESYFGWTVAVPSVAFPHIPGMSEFNWATLTLYGMSCDGQSISLAGQGFVLPKGLATDEEDGLMSSYDKAKLDGLSNYSLPLAGSSTRGGIKIGYSASGANVPVQLSSEKAYVALTKSAVTSALGYTPPTSSDISTAISNLVDSSPDALNTLNELAAALGDDPNFATTVTNNLAGKLGKTEKAADSSKLNGQEASYYLNYNNLTNKPTIPSAFTLPTRLAEYSTGGYSDANDATPQGWHYMTSTATNRPPFKQVDGLTGSDYRIMSTAYGTTWLQQIATDFRSNDIFTRRKQNGTWQGWTALVKMQQGLTSPVGTNNAIARWDSSRNATIKDSNVTIDDNGVLNATTLQEGGTSLSNKYQAKLGYTPLSTAGGTIEGDLTLHATSGDSPKLRFQRGDNTGTLTDWNINVSSGALNFNTVATSGATTENTIVSIGYSGGMNVVGGLKEDGVALSSKYQAKGNYLTGITKDQVTTALGYTPANGTTIASQYTNGLMSAAQAVKLNGIADNANNYKLYRHYLAMAITHNSQTLIGAVSFVDSRSTAHTLATMNSTYNAVPMYFTATNSTTHGFTGMLEFSSASQVKLTGLRYSSGTMSVLTTVTVNIAQLLKASVQEV